MHSLVDCTTPLLIVVKLETVVQRMRSHTTIQHGTKGEQGTNSNTTRDHGKHQQRRRDRWTDGFMYSIRYPQSQEEIYDEQERGLRKDPQRIQHAYSQRHEYSRQHGAQELAVEEMGHIKRRVYTKRRRNTTTLLACSLHVRVILSLPPLRRTYQ